MLNSAEHEILNAHKNIKKFSILQAQISLEVKITEFYLESVPIYLKYCLQLQGINVSVQV